MYAIVWSRRHGDGQRACLLAWAQEEKEIREDSLDSISTSDLAIACLKAGGSLWLGWVLSSWKGAMASQSH